MLRLLCLCALAALSLAMPWAELQDSNTLFFEPSLDQLWEDFKSDHNKQYESDLEEQTRKEIFHGHLKLIKMHNYLHEHGKKSYRLGINEYADLEHHEFVGIMNGLLKTLSKPKTGTSTYLSPASGFVTLTLPDEVDWRQKGYVTPVKNQGQCGSCWSFSTTGALEGQHFKKTGKLVSLSEQNLVDCSEKWGNNGCNGGLMDYAFQYIKDNKGDDTEEAYPYEARDGPCRFKPDSVGATDTGYTDITSGDESALKEALGTIGPISIAIDASHQSFQLYQSGVYDEPECSSSELDHGVLAVGYGTKDGQDYWLVKNSWGETWGDQGYIYMSRNKDNQCGVATSASYPLV